MAVHIHSDASIIDDVARGAYIILNKRNKKERIIRRTPQVKDMKTHDIEMLTACQALIHAFKKFPKETSFELYSDSMHVINHFKMNGFELMSSKCNIYFKRLLEYIDKNPREDRVNLSASHISAHSGTLKSEPQKMNYMCDMLASMKNI